MNVESWHGHFVPPPPPPPPLLRQNNISKRCVAIRCTNTDLNRCSHVLQYHDL